MIKNTFKKNKIDFVSASAFLGAILIMPLVLFSGVLKPQVIENQAAGFPASSVKVIAGDMDGNGVLNGRDAALMLNEFEKPLENRVLEFDLNGDGSVDLQDYEAMVKEMNGNGRE